MNEWMKEGGREWRNGGKEKKKTSGEEGKKEKERVGVYFCPQSPACSAALGPVPLRNLTDIHSNPSSFLPSEPRPKQKVPRRWALSRMTRPCCPGHVFYLWGLVWLRWSPSHPSSTSQGFTKASEITFAHQFGFLLLGASLPWRRDWALLLNLAQKWINRLPTPASFTGRPLALRLSPTTVRTSAGACPDGHNDGFKSCSVVFISFCEI